MLSRRNFLSGLTTGAATLPFTAALHALEPAAGPGHDSGLLAADFRLSPLPSRAPAPDASSEPWQKHVRRVGQTNMTEHDPAVMNIDAWADYWHSAQVDIVFVSVTGILAFYPSKVPYHRHGKFLNGRDFFGECVAAAKRRGMRVVARMSPDLNWDDALSAQFKSGLIRATTRMPRFFAAATHSPKKSRPFRNLPWR